jgi:hypothetical protein
MTDEQLLEEYNKEIHKQYAKQGEMTVARLIESHRHLRQLNIERNGAFDEARKEGYKHGYEWGMKNVASNTIQYKDLCKMTIQDLANLIGTEDD